jgi:hypothetical protein
VPYTTLGKNLMLDALKGTNPTTPITHVGLLSADAGKSVTSASDIFTSTAHGYSAGDLVVFTSLTGGSNLVTTRPYYVIAANLAANTFQVALTPGGTAVTHGSNVTAGTAVRLVEISGGSPAYARVAIAFAAAAGAVIDDSTNGAVVNVPGGVTVSYQSFHSASTAGTLLAIDDVTPETFAGQGTYTVTDAKLDLLATA